MIIGIDGNEANIQERVGVNIYTYELLIRFARASSPQYRFIVYLKNPPLSDMPSQSRYFTYVIIPGPLLWSKISLPLYLKFRKPDVLFCPAHYTPALTGITKVVTIHDLSYEFFPEEFRKKDIYTLKNWTRQSVSHASKIIAVSKNTAKDITKIYKVSRSKISIIYNGYTRTKVPASLSKYALKIPGPFILYVGTIQPRKNIERLIESFAQLCKKDDDLHLVIAGKKGWLYDNILSSALKYGIDKRVSFLGFVDNLTKMWLYKNARLFVLPSLYEGFGLPILEAMSYRCPVVASKTSSIPEIGKNACLYFNPNSIISIKKAIENVLYNKPLRKKLIEESQKRIKNFSWDKCAKQTLHEIVKTVKKL